MDDLYKSDAWKNATASQRREFISKVQADKRIEKERLVEEARKKKRAEKMFPAQKTKKQKRKERLIKRNSKPITIAGVDVTSSEFLNTYEWRKLRMQALKLYGPKCMCCGSTPANGAVVNVDHIKPRKLFPSLALEIKNLQILCHECNHGKGNWDQTDWRK